MVPAYRQNYRARVLDVNDCRVQRGQSPAAWLDGGVVLVSGQIF